MKKVWSFLTLILMSLLTACASEPETIEVTRIVIPTSAASATNLNTDKPILDQVRARGRLICGIRNNLIGFGYINDAGEYAGFDVDLCRAVAAAVLGNREAVDFVPLSAAERGIALQQRQVDLLSRNVTWTSSREVAWGNFTNIMFYDGQSFMVRADANIQTLADLDEQPICVTTGTTTETNLVNSFRQRNLRLNMIVFNDLDDIYGAYEKNLCVAVTSDKSQLLSVRHNFDNPDDHHILNDIISKEPLTPVVPDGDDEWLDIVRTVMYVLINAEELGVTSINASEMRQSDNVDIRRLLGTEQSFGQADLRLNQDFAYDIITQVGNYGEIYNVYFGLDGEAFFLPRGLNELSTNGGILYAPPLK
ncbi:MAG TPA: amino acid ABC transporter substrate-binding protein [Anaerolineae bacterium]|nr:amino acid ABC transporter substrate-binding protein [Anaerolineae bacterium]